MPLLRLREEEFQLRKIISLFLNEMLKIRKKVAVLVLIIVMTVGIGGCSVFFKIGSNVDDSDDELTEYWIEENVAMEQELLREIESYEEIKEGEDKYYTDSLVNLKNQCHEAYLFGRYTRENNIKESSFKDDLLYLMQNTYWLMLNQEFYDEEGTDSEQYKSEKAKYEKYDSIIKTGTYGQYIEYSNKLIEEDNEIPEAEKRLKIAKNNYLYQVCPSGEYNSIDEKDNVQRILSKKAEIETALESGIDFEKGGNLTDERRKELELSLEVINKRIEGSVFKGTTSEEVQGFSVSTSLSIGNIFTIIILIIIAGAMMSAETSTGTIKSLIIAPVKRWKIYTAKYLALLFVMVVLTIYVYITTILINGLLFGFSSFGTEVYAVFGKVVTINYFAVQFVYVMCSLVPLVVLVTFAYMMSIVTKSTAASVSVTMGVYFGGSIVHTILMGFLQNRPYITKFLPFNNTDWFSKMFENMIGSDMSLNVLVNGEFFESPTTLCFSAIYVLALLVCMNWIAADSFCRKDIK